jgi:hypothetical protein
MKRKQLLKLLKLKMKKFKNQMIRKSKTTLFYNILKRARKIQDRADATVIAMMMKMGMYSQLCKVLGVIVSLL